MSWKVKSPVSVSTGLFGSPILMLALSAVTANVLFGRLIRSEPLGSTIVWSTSAPVRLIWSTGVADPLRPGIDPMIGAAEHCRQSPWA